MATDHAAEHKSKRVSLFGLLKDCRWHTWKEIRRVAGVRYSARLRELKRLGYQIQSEPLENHRGKRYRLTSTRRGKPQEKRVKAFLPPADVAMLLSEGIVTPAVKQAIASAYESFEVNKENL